MHNHDNNSDIANHFQSKFKKILDNKDCQKINQKSEAVIYSEFSNRKMFYLTLNEMNNAIARLKPMSGPDGIHANHFKLAPMDFKQLFLRFLNSCISHAFMPESMLVAEITPRVNDKFGNASNSNNYRPVMSSNTSLKIFEYSLLPTLERYISISLNQFGYRKGTSTTMAVLTVKEIISKYVKSGTEVHAAFLDMSKAYDCLNHHTLIEKLLDSELPLSVVAILKSLYFNQEFHTSYNDSKSGKHCIGNGIRQGGIMSGLLFNFYINNLVKRMNSKEKGCTLNGCKYALVAYADDIVVMAPSKQGLQQIVNDTC